MPTLRLALAIALAVAACAGKTPPPAPPPAAEPTAQPAPAPAPPPAPAAPAEPPRRAAVSPASVYFEFDSSDLSADGRSTLQSLSGALKERADLQVRIEGNCDERGSSEYNLALGQRRADAAKRYLVNLGVDASRVTAISNGEEKPRAPGHDEAAWRENRRDDLLPGNEAVGRSMQ
jgi:peptidoglycan-associated lipoprotein